MWTHPLSCPGCHIRWFLPDRALGSFGTHHLTLSYASIVHEFYVFLWLFICKNDLPFILVSRANFPLATSYPHVVWSDSPWGFTSVRIGYHRLLSIGFGLHWLLSNSIGSHWFASGHIGYFRLASVYSGSHQVTLVCIGSHQVSRLIMSKKLLYQLRADCDSAICEQRC